jgi:hypothetical protein
LIAMALSIAAERRLLQAVVAVAALVPITGGLAGVLLGVGLDPRPTAGAADLDSHWRYLSGLLLGIGLAAWASVARIEAMGARFRLIALIVVVGGLGRLCSLAAVGRPSTLMLAALVMELVVTPALAIWHHRFVHRCAP